MFQSSDFLTIALLVALEGLLSADNAMVLAVLVLGLPKAEQQKALRYGILGAFAFRTIATLLAVYLIHLAWVKLVGAGYLLYLVYGHFSSGGGAAAARRLRRPRPAFGLTRVLGDRRQGRTDRHRVRRRFDSGRRGDVVEDLGRS